MFQIQNSYNLPLTTQPVIYIGYDFREHKAVRVLQHSISTHSTVPIYTKTLNLTNLRRSGLYRRAPHHDSTCWSQNTSSDPTTQHMKDLFDQRPFSTEFSFSRFLVPALNQYEGYALFMDCDMYFRSDPMQLFQYVTQPDQQKYALWCVKHNDQPSEQTKMYGCPQTKYNKKNWSSFVVWNCGHPAHQNLTVDDVNTKPGSWLHQFKWLSSEDLIGALPEEWNFLDNHSPETLEPKNMHFTTGGPWFPNWKPKRDIDHKYSQEWLELEKKIS